MAQQLHLEAGFLGIHRLHAKTFCLYDADFIVLIVVIFFKELGSESSGSLLFVN